MPASVPDKYSPSQDNVIRYLVDSMSVAEISKIQKLEFIPRWKSFDKSQFYSINVTTDDSTVIRIKGTWGGIWLEELIKYFEKRDFVWQTR